MVTKIGFGPIQPVEAQIPDTDEQDKKQTNLISEQCVNRQYAGTKSSLETNTSRHCKIQAVPPEMCSLQDL
jgi:hypothetical protein